ncbi:MAG: hypothetical protein R3B81_11650 [bacterium]
MRALVRFLALSLILLAFVAPARATDVFTDELAFLAASGPLIMESFECFEPEDPAESDPILTSWFTMTIEPAFGSTIAPMSIQGAGFPNGPHPTHGDRQVLAGNTSFTNGQFELTFTFDYPIAEFALWITDFGDYNSGSLTFANDAGDVYVILSNPPQQPDGGEAFFGVRNTDQPFQTVVLSKSTQGDGIGMDQVRFSGIGTIDCGIVAAPSVDGATWGQVKSRYH